MDYNDVLRQECAKEFRQPKGVTEDNWKSRMDFCNKMTAAIDTYGTGDRLPRDFSTTIESYFNNILECAISERTQLSISASKLFTAIPKILGRDLVPHIDRIMPVFVKLCANTKQVIVKVAAQAVASIVENAGFSSRMLYHVCQTFEEKAVGPKQHATNWLQTMMKEYHRSLTTPREVEMISKSLSSALEDADPSVRTSSRATYWTFNKIDKDATADIMDKLNKSAKTALQNDPNNPDKKAGTSRPAPPRPKSSLATAKEQLRKKKLEEEAQQAKKGLNSSVASHDGTIEVHEPVRPKVRATKTETPAATPATSERRHAERTKTTDSRMTHKKTLSTDEEVVTKTSNSSRLLSAPVRRPRINVTPLNHEQDHHTKITRPASRSEHVRSEHNSQASQAREAHKHDSRPTSSSSSKSVSIPAPTIAPPKSNLGPSALDDKENNPAIATLGKKHRPVKSTERSDKSKDDLKSSVRSIAPVHDKIIDDPTSEPVQPLHNRSVPNYNASSSLENSFPRQALTSRSDQPDYIDLKNARSYLTHCMREPPSSLNELGRCKKLRSSLEQFPDLITDIEIWTDFFQYLCYALVARDSPRADTPQPYARQLILQMTIPLIQNYPQWSYSRVHFWIWFVILYRSTLPIKDLKDRRSEICMKNINKIITSSNSPVSFIVVALRAVESGEATILSGSGFNAQDSQEHTITSHGGNWYEPTAYHDDFDDEEDPRLNEVADLVKQYLKTISQTASEAPYPPTLPVLYDTALQTLELALTEANRKGERFGRQRTHDLCELARKCLESYDYMTKRSVIPYIKALYAMMENREEFFAYFKQEGSRNLLEYYLHGGSR